MALGISIIAISNFGNGPWDAVNIGLSEKTRAYQLDYVWILLHLFLEMNWQINKYYTGEFPNILNTMITSIF